MSASKTKLDHQKKHPSRHNQGVEYNTKDVTIESNVNITGYGRPVEEVDPTVTDHTFCAISRKFGKHYVFRFSCEDSLYLFHPNHPLRQLAIFIVTHRFFDILIISTIFLNCITLAMNTNEINAEGKKIRPPYDPETDMIEYIFLCIYLMEMVLKIIAKGFVLHKYSYLRSFWNILDFVVIGTGIQSVIAILISPDNDEYADTDSALEALRTLRVLRVIKTITILPGLRFIINVLVNSAIELLEVMTLTLFCLMIFSLFALEVYMGKFRQKCVLIKGGVADPNNFPIEFESPHSRDYSWHKWVSDPVNWRIRNPAYPHSEPMPCGNETSMRNCPVGYVCLGDLGENPDNGWTSFDDFFKSMLVTLQLLTLDFMERPMELILSTSGTGSLLFLFLVIFLGAFYLLNLMVAVVTTSYENEAHNVILKEKLTKEEKLELHKTASNFSFQDPTKLNPIVFTEFRRRTNSEKALWIEKRLGLSYHPAIQPEFHKSSDELRDTVLGDAVYGLLGRQFTADMQLAKFDVHGPPPDSVDFTEEEIKIIPRKSIFSNYSNIDRSKPDPSQRNVVIEMASDRTTESTPRVTFIEPSKSKEVPISEVEYCSEEDSDVENLFPEINPGKWNRARQIKRFALQLKKTLIPIVNHSMFECFITTCIICNTVLLSVEHHGQPEVMKNLLDKGNNFFMAIFTTECIIKLLALQKEYFASGWNIFDIFIVLISFLDVILEVYFSISLIKGMRLLRVFKLAQSWITMKVLLNIIFSTFAELGNVTLIFIIIIYIFAVLGMHVVGPEFTAKNFGALDDTTKFPRWNWSNFGFAFVLVFRIICGEWIEPLLECLEAHKHKKTEYKCFLIYLLTSIVGNLVVLNLFLALLLNSFNTEELTIRRQQELESSGKLGNARKIIGLLMAKKSNAGPGAIDLSTQEAQSLSFSKQPDSIALARFKKISMRVINENRRKVAEQAIARAEKKIKETEDAQNIGLINNDGVSMKGSEPKVAGDCFPRKYLKGSWNQISGLDWPYWDTMRSYAVKIVNHPAFEYSILVLIFASSITLCFEDVHLDKNEDLKQILFIMNYCFTTVFIIEMILKWFSLGLWNYFTSSWTILDAFIVIVSVVTLYFDTVVRFENQGLMGKRRKAKNLHALKALRTLRALRPLRAISRWQGMKIVVNALMYAIPAIFNVLLVCLLFWLIFAIMGVQFFKGKFYKCVNSEGDVIDASLAATKQVCCAKANTLGYSWINSNPNFDNVADAYLSLLQIATYEGWMEQMIYATDSVDVDQQPERYNSAYYYMFFIVFILLGGYFALNLFIGVIIDNFNMLKKKYEGSLLDIFLTPSQRQYYTTMQKLGKKKPQRVIRRPSFPLLCPYYDMAMSKKLELFVFSMIFLNMCVMGFEVYGQEQFSVDLLAGINSFFTVVYAIEGLIKIVGLRQYYFTVPWNIFDFVLVVASLGDLLLGRLIVNFPIPPTMLRVVRIVRIGRILRLVKSARGVRKLLFALVVSLPALFNIGCLLALVTFIYAILGMALFMDAPLNAAVDQMLNFRTFLNAVFMLIRLMTSAGWNDVLEGLTYIHPVCGSYRTIECGLDGEPECPNYAMALAYLVTYIIISSKIIINMYVAIILENFDEANKGEEIGIIEEDLEMFYVIWSRYDPAATQFIRFGQLSEFLSNLDPPLRFPKPNMVAIVAFDLPICRGSKIHCLDVLHACVKHVLGHIDDSQQFRKLQEQMEKKFNKQFPTRKLLDIMCSTRIWKIQQNAAIVIQRAWRAYYYRRTHPPPIAKLITPKSSISSFQS